MIIDDVQKNDSNTLYIKVRLNEDASNLIATSGTTVHADNQYRLTVSTVKLQEVLNCGKKTAIHIGNSAQAKIIVGRKVLWNLNLIQQYLNSIAK